MHPERKTMARPARADATSEPDASHHLNHGRWNASWYTWLALAVLAGFGIGIFAGTTVREPQIATVSNPPSIRQCTDETVVRLGATERSTPDTLRQALEHCYSLIRSEGLLKDFATRELNFIQQYRANGVLMWMVVAVTLSGVVLAGLQLMASYELARAKKRSINATHELLLERDRVVLKSSTIGLFILVLSFAFFLVFVFYVYRFEQTEDQSVRIPYGAPVLPPGGLGPPISPK